MKVMDDKKPMEWHFDFRLSSDDPISKSQCNELFHIAVEWAENNGLDVVGGYSEHKKPKYTLKELLDKCDPDGVDIDWKSLL